MVLLYDRLAELVQFEAVENPTPEQQTAKAAALDAARQALKQHAFGGHTGNCTVKEMLEFMLRGGFYQTELVVRVNGEDYNIDVRVLGALGNAVREP